MQNVSPELSVILADSAIRNTKNPCPELKMYLHRFYGVMLSRTNRLEQAIDHIDTALAYYANENEQVNDADAYCWLLLLKGDVLFQAHNFNKANDCIFLAQQFASQHAGNCTQVNLLVNIGYILYRQKRYENARQNFSAALQQIDRCNAADYYRIQELLDNIGLCFDKEKQYDSAVYYFSNAIKVIQEKAPVMAENKQKAVLFSSQALGVVNGNLANVYGKKQLYDSAIALSKISIALNGRVCCEQKDAQLVQARLLEWYYHKHNLPAMHDELLALRNNLDTLPNNDAELMWLQQAAVYNEAVHNSSQALQYYKQYHAKKDSLYTIEKSGYESDVIKDLQLKTQTADLQLLKKNNQIKNVYLWLFVVVSVMAIAIGILVYRNYNKSRKNEKLLRRLNAEVSAKSEDLEIANKEKDRILNVVAHDLRNPIGGMAYLSDMILMEEQELTPRSGKYLNLIKTSSANSLVMINELLGMRSGKQTHLLSKMDVNEIVNETAQLHQYKAQEKGLHLIVEINNENIFINGNKERFSRLLGNLITNAIKFSKSGSAIKITTDTKEQTVQIIVQDEGIGIPAEQLNNLFDTFSTVRRTGTNGEKSFGLGLSICKEITEEHNGEIIAESTEDVGTTFTVILPLL